MTSEVLHKTGNIRCPYTHTPSFYHISILVTLAGYCVHSTLVPAIVPIFFLRQLRKSTRRENKWPMVGGALERGRKKGLDRLLILNQPTVCFWKKPNFPHQLLSTALFWPSVCVFVLFWFHLFGVGGVLQCSTSPIRGRIGKSSLSCPCSLCLPSLNS